MRINLINLDKFEQKISRIRRKMFFTECTIHRFSFEKNDLRLPRKYHQLNDIMFHIQQFCKNHIMNETRICECKVEIESILKLSNSLTVIVKRSSKKGKYSF